MTSAFQIQRAIEICRKGGVISYPTEAVFGLGCDPLNESAVNKILQLKIRPMSKGMILIAADLQQLLPYIECSNEQLNLLQKTPEQPTTWLVRKSPATPEWITGKHNKIAVRITQHPVAKALCENLGQAMISTSANPTGHKPAKTLLRARRYFHHHIDYYVPGKTGLLKKPTQIRDIENGNLIRV